MADFNGKPVCLLSKVWLFSAHQSTSLTALFPMIAELTSNRLAQLPDCEFLKEKAIHLNLPINSSHNIFAPAFFTIQILYLQARSNAGGLPGWKTSQPVWVHCCWSHWVANQLLRQTITWPGNKPASLWVESCKVERQIYFSSNNKSDETIALTFFKGNDTFGNYSRQILT